jgi:hypothetical protein
MMSPLVEKGRQIVLQELKTLGLNPTPESIMKEKGPIEIDQPKKIRLIVRTSAGANEPRRWDAGNYQPNNFSDSCFYIFINRWKDESRPYELFVIPSKVIQKTVNWKARRPKYNMPDDHAYSYKNNWGSVLDLIRLK